MPVPWEEVEEGWGEQLSPLVGESSWTEGGRKGREGGRVGGGREDVEERAVNHKLF